MTAFTDFINLLRLKVNIFHNAKVCGNWVINEHTLGSTCFHVVTTGQCLLKIPGHMDVQFNCGDLVIFPKELEHSMHSIGQQQGEQQHLSYQTELLGTGMLCGEVSILHLYRNQLLEALPAVLLIKNDEKAPWLNNIVELLLHESCKTDEANSVLLNRLSEMLFVYALRHYLEYNKTQQGILSLYGNEKLATALKYFHDSPDKKWDLNTLAQKAGMSRTAFASKFKLHSGWTVNQYTTWWRMQIAWDLLQQGDKVGSVSYQVGYQSEAAFSRVFKNQFMVSAGSVRRKG
jgi:AraC-like DNA-binding protein